METHEQQAVVDRPADALLLLVADAGMGKTHTLMRRVERLAAEEAAGGILVLTFSRSAVRDLRVRLAPYGPAAHRVQARAFDSWTLDLLTRIDPDGGWPGRPYREQQEAALQLLATGLVDELYDGLRHVVVDEAQDLVGEHRQLVEALLERVDCGFTIAGDPEQSIHGEGGEGPRFFAWLRETFGADLEEARLTRNFRNRTWEAAAALPHTSRMRQVSAADQYRELWATLQERVNVGRLEQGFAADALTRFEGTTGVLCRNGGQAMVVSERLHALGVPHRLQRAARERVVPAWVGGLVGRCTGALLSASRFVELLPEVAAPPDLTPEQLWRILQRAASGDPGGGALDLAALMSGISAGWLPDELAAQPPARFLVSSFDRARGLEFDRVLVADPGPVPYGRPEAEARLLYTAMTRARYELFLLAAPESGGLVLEEETGRWSLGRDGMQILPGDVHTADPAGVRDFMADAAEVQRYLATRVRPGDEVALERMYLQSTGRGESPPYILVHEGWPVGTASAGFRRQLCMRLGEPAQWPRTITGARVDAVETVVGPAAAAAHAGLGPYGVWLAPRLAGIGRFIWDKKEEDRS